jgi:dihydrofolate reductase
MSRLRVHTFSISLDGFGAGLHQDLENPFGAGGMVIPQWMMPTRNFHKMIGKEGGTTGIDDDFVTRGFNNVGAWILGRNMFSPLRGPWLDDTWKGWWGDNPPYHSAVFILTHHPRPSITMEGGTTFHFVTDGIQAALNRATEAAKGQDVRVGGGVATVRQYLSAGLVDQIHIAQVPALVGAGEHLMNGIDLPRLGYRVTEHVASANATHVVLERSRT